ncbi:hypothetical protein [Dactylosporangium sp. NPDC000521]|uniref:hypothetical protein n=1 Tax=Dactylosporangium sp. NPDC000521 TaxID=3363975 RepID=UPI00367974D8
MTDEQRILDWARREAAKLPPFTADEAREVGLIAARIDARRAETARQSQTSTTAAAA